MDHLKLINLNKKFGTVQAAKDVCLEIGKGELVTLLGPSGCGKTTALHMIAGFIRPDAGTITLNGQDITFLPAYRRRTPMVFQEYALFPHMNVFENIAYGLRVQKKDRQSVRKKVEEILDLLGLPQTVNRFPNQLSGGQQQRIALARALVLDPEVLLLDEPLSNLDAKLRVKIRYEINELRKKFHMTTVFVTHDQEEALSISDKIAVMNKGVVEQFGQPDEIYYYPKNEFVAGFIGESNFLPVVIEGADKTEKDYHIRFGWRNRMFSVFGKQADLNKGQQRKLLLRPEAINIFRPEQVGADSEHLPGFIKGSSFLGTIMRYWVDIGGQEIVVDDSKMYDHGVFSGEVRMAFHQNNIHFL